MDKIQFRGRRVKGGEWIEGDLVYFHGDTPCIQTNMHNRFGQWYVDAYEIDPATIEMIQKGDNNGQDNGTDIPQDADRQAAALRDG